MTTNHQPGDGHTIAAEIAMWQRAARQLPLPQVHEMTGGLLIHLGHCLDDLNVIWLDSYPDSGQCTGPSPEMIGALTATIRQACAAAIFALGAQQRTRSMAEAN